MPLIQGGPPEWIWERTPEKLKGEMIPTDRTGSRSTSCGRSAAWRSCGWSSSLPRRPGRWPRCWPNTGRSGRQAKAK